MRNGQWVDVECATAYEYATLRARCKHYPSIMGAEVSSDRPEFKVINRVKFARALDAYRGTVLPLFASRAECELHRDE